MKMHYVEQTNWVIVSLGPSIILLLYTDYLVQFLFKSGIDLSEPVNQTSSETEPSFWSYQVKPPHQKKNLLKTPWNTYSTFWSWSLQSYLSSTKKNFGDRTYLFFILLYESFTWEEVCSELSVHYVFVWHTYLLSKTPCWKQVPERIKSTTKDRSQKYCSSSKLIIKSKLVPNVEPKCRNVVAQKKVKSIKAQNSLDACWIADLICWKLKIWTRKSRNRKLQTLHYSIYLSIIHESQSPCAMRHAPTPVLQCCQVTRDDESLSHTHCVRYFTGRAAKAKFFHGLSIFYSRV